jgi:hypothetical protein
MKAVRSYETLVNFHRTTRKSSVMSSQENLCNGGSVLREVRVESMNITSMSFRLKRVKVKRDQGLAVMRKIQMSELLT